MPAATPPNSSSSVTTTGPYSPVFASTLRMLLSPIDFSPSQICSRAGRKLGRASVNRLGVSPRKGKSASGAAGEHDLHRVRLGHAEELAELLVFLLARRQALRLDDLL